MNIVLVEFDSGNGVEAEAFKDNQSLINWYEEVIIAGLNNNSLVRFTDNVNNGLCKFDIDFYSFTIYYKYPVM